MSIYGSALDIYKEYRRRYGFKAYRQHVEILISPSTIDQNQDLHVRMPNLGIHDVVIPSTQEITFDVALESSDVKRYAVNNFAKSLITKLDIEYEGNKIQSIHDFDVWEIYKDKWLSSYERERLIAQGIDDSEVVNKIRLKTDGTETSATVDQKAIAAVYGNRYSIPIGKYFELTRYLPFAGIGDRLSFVLTFAPYSSVVKDVGEAADGKYTITNIALEFDVVKDPQFAVMIKSQLSNISLQYDRILRHRIIPLKKEDTQWNIQTNVPSESLKALVLIFVDTRKAYATDPEKFYNPLISKVNITVEGEPNQLYSHGLTPKDMYQNVFQYFTCCNDTSVFQYFHNVFFTWNTTHHLFTVKRIDFLLFFF